MNKLNLLRALLVLFVLTYFLAMSTAAISPDSPKEMLDYVEWANQQHVSDSSIWGMLCLLGHVLDIVGIVLMFIRRKLGVYFLIMGFLSCIGASTGVPSLQTTLTATLMAFVNIFWGAIVTLVFTSSDEIFSQKNTSNS
jgi:hypothetical protein